MYEEIKDGLLIRKLLNGNGREAVKFEEEKKYRRALGLPVTKDIVYYDITDNYKKYNVQYFWIEKMYTNWNTIKIFISKGNVLIHGSFLKEMQKPDFIEKFKEELNATDQS